MGKKNKGKNKGSSEPKTGAGKKMGINGDEILVDTLGSYTGTPADGLFPEQDADDL